MTAIDGKDRFQSFDEILDYLEKPCLWYECFWKFMVDKLKNISISTFSTRSIDFNLKKRIDNLKKIVNKKKVTLSIPTFSLDKIVFPVLAITIIIGIYSLFRGCSSDNREVVSTHSSLCDTTEKMRECIERYKNIFDKHSILIENIDEFKELVDGGVSIDSLTNKSGETALHHLSWKGKYEFVKVLVDRDKNIINIKDKDGETALFEAIAYANSPYAINHNRKIIELLLDSGASINIQSKKPSSNSILSYAVKYKMVDIVDELVDRDVCSYEKGIQYGHKNIYDFVQEIELYPFKEKSKEIKKILKKGGC